MTVLVAERRVGEAPVVRLTGSTEAELDGSSASDSQQTESFASGLHLFLGGVQGGDVGKIAEVLVYNRALASAEVDEVRGYLAAKWRANGPGAACAEGCLFSSCGDGVLVPDEFCDEAMAFAQLGKCAPDCAHVVAQKRIVLSAVKMTGNLGANPISTADLTCPPGQKAMFTFSNARLATTVPNQVVEPIDWVLQTYTRSVNVDDQLL